MALCLTVWVICHIRIEDRKTTPASHNWELVRCDDVLASTQWEKEGNLVAGQLRGDWRLFNVLGDLMESNSLGFTGDTA